METILATHEEVIYLFSEFANAILDGLPDQAADTSFNHMHDNQELALSLVKPFPFHLLAYLSVVIFAFNWAVRLIIVRPASIVLFKLFTRRTIGEATLTKFAQATMELIFYTTFAALGLLLTWNISWVRLTLQDSIYTWTNQPANDASILPPALEFFYVAYGARYVQAFASIMLEEKRKDFWEMFVHHIVTTLLVVLSYHYGLTKNGILYFVVFDLADPFLQLGKIVLYFRAEADIPIIQSILNTFADIVFGLFVVSFAITRIYMHTYLVYSFVYDIWRLTQPEEMSFIKYLPQFPYPGGLCLVSVLAALQFIWFSMILKVLIRKVVSGEDVDDSRSEPDIDDKKDK